MADDAKLADEIGKMKAEPLLPVEKQLIARQSPAGSWPARAADLDQPQILSGIGVKSVLGSEFSVLSSRF